MVSLNVDYVDDGKKITTFITSKYPELNINNLYKALRKKDIKINGKRVNNNVCIHYGDLVVNKPKNIEVEGKNSLTEILEKEYNFIKPCHRIDRNTIGLVIFAKNEKILNEFINLFKNFEIEKHYIACCYGISKVKSKKLTGYLFKDKKKKIVYISETPKKGYVKIETSYKVIEENKEKKVSLLDVNLHTGRTHQIRAHLAFSSLPIIGDGKYGSYEINKRFNENTQLLASYSITFHISSPDSPLYYLNNTTIKLKKIPFTEVLEN